jgi:hypothetical protein
MATVAPRSDHGSPGPGSGAADAGGARRHGLVVRVLLGAGALLAVLAIVAVWANRQALDADRWADTSTAVLQDPAVESRVAAYVVDAVYANVDVPAAVRDAVPEQLQPLAGPIAAGLRSVATQTTTAALGRPRIEELWRTANRVTAAQFIRIAKGESRAITNEGNAVVLDLRPLALDVVGRLGLSGRVVADVPPDAARIVILRGDQVESLQKGVRWVRGLAIVLTVGALALLALAVVLARGWRREALLWAGISLAGAGAVVLVVRKIMGDHVVDSLADPAARPAAEAVWSIGTGVLRDTAQGAIIAAIPLVLGAVLAGPSRAAVAARRRLAPSLREHAGEAYALLGLALLLVVAWAPIPATRKVLPMLIMAALAALGLRTLRRQALDEFPPPR